MNKIDRLKEIVEILDRNIYQKDYNFLNEDKFSEGIIEFYSRDFCRNISFKELLRWYLDRLDYDEEYNDIDERDYDEAWNNHCDYYTKQKDLFMELIDIYILYYTNDGRKFEELKTKIKDLIE